MKEQTQALEHASVKQYCKALRVPMIGAHFIQLAEQAIKEQRSHIGYLEALLTMESEERDRHAIQQRLRDAKLPRLKTLEEFDFNQARQIPAAKIRELAEGGYIRQVEQEVLARVKACPPEFFERLVVKLLTTIGYGGSLADAGKAIGKTGDGGIDGVIKEDKLGLDLLYIQAKRWDNTTVGRPEIQRFVGALHGKRAKKGIFITTSTFSRDATEYAESVETKVILIDGARLTELMFDYGVGVSTLNSYEVKRIDSDFFEDDFNAEDTKTLDELGILGKHPQGKS